MRRTLLVLALTTSLVPSGSGFFGQLWDAFSVAWGLSAISDEGCGMDPYGRCSPAPQPESDAGCGVDPDGCPKSS